MENNLQLIKETLWKDFRVVSNWFHEVFMILIDNKYHHMHFRKIVLERDLSVVNFLLKMARKKSF